MLDRYLPAGAPIAISLPHRQTNLFGSNSLVLVGRHDCGEILMKVSNEMTRGSTSEILQGIVACLLALSPVSVGVVEAAFPNQRKIFVDDHGTSNDRERESQNQGSVSLGPACVTAMAYSCAEDLIYAVDGECDGLIIIDEMLRLRIHVGPLGFPVVSGLVVDRTGAMFAVDGQADQLLRVDAKTGRATSIGPLGFSSVQSLACDANNRVYGVDTLTDQLVLIDTYTGKATAVAQISAPSVFSLTFVNGDVLYGADVATNSLYRIDVQTGACTPLSRSKDNFFEVHGMTSCRDGRLLAYAVRQDALCELNPSMGTVDRMILMRQRTVSSFVTQAIPDALQTRILFGLSLLSILLAMVIRCVRFFTQHVAHGWGHVKNAWRTSGSWADRWSRWKIVAWETH